MPPYGVVSALEKKSRPIVLPSCMKKLYVESIPKPSRSPPPLQRDSLTERAVRRSDSDRCVACSNPL